ncbi:NAD-dependent epimerase/dehydratase family protein [Paraflavitalea speifideaquila]|uniref:NAD-dependent epimerase/dehydratase family protein n=1 Tax=Paraflavitalea speifideaquila TaxID=3076558 RepID=UPI003312FFA4
MTTIFITGGTGYIGKRLIKALLKEGIIRLKHWFVSSQPPNSLLAARLSPAMHWMPPAT